MRITAIAAGVFFCAVTIFSANTTVHAESLPSIVLASSSNVGSNAPGVEVVNLQPQLQKSASAKEEKKPVEHVVAEGETLTSIANQYQSTWQRLYSRNVDIANPDVIDVGKKLVVPSPDESLPERPLPQPVAPVEPISPPATTKTAALKPAVVIKKRGSAGGNTYSPGYCTWYAKSRRPDLPNNLGNADTWVARARAQGIATGSTPRAGAIGQSGMHVVYVESVNGDGTVNISEMNHVGVGVVSSRTVVGNYFQYIY